MDIVNELVRLEGRVAEGHRAMEQRDRLIRQAIDGGMRQAEAWRLLNSARVSHGAPPLSRAAVEAILRRTAPKPAAEIFAAEAAANPEVSDPF